MMCIMNLKKCKKIIPRYYIVFPYDKSKRTWHKVRLPTIIHWSIGCSSICVLCKCKKALYVCYCIRPQLHKESETCDVERFCPGLTLYSLHFIQKNYGIRRILKKTKFVVTNGNTFCPWQFHYIILRIPKNQILESGAAGQI